MMLLKSRFLLFYLLISLGIHTQAQGTAFERSVVLLQDDNPLEAIRAMDSIITSGEASSELYCNLAQAHFTSGNKAKAILNYEKALLTDPNNGDILKAIKAIRKQLDVQITDIPDFILVTYYRSMANILSASTWSLLQVVFGIIAITMLFLYLFPRDTMPLSTSNIKIWGICALALSILSLVFASSKKSYELGKDQGIVMASDIALHQAPDKQSPEVTPISDGNKVFIISELGDWYKVSLRDKDTGWIKKEEVAIF